MEKPSHTILKKDTQALVHFLTKNGQAPLPTVELIEQSRPQAHRRAILGLARRKHGMQRSY